MNFPFFGLPPPEVPARRQWGPPTDKWDAIAAMLSAQPDQGSAEDNALIMEVLDKLRSREQQGGSGAHSECSAEKQTDF